MRNIVAFIRVGRIAIIPVVALTWAVPTQAQNGPAPAKPGLGGAGQRQGATARSRAVALPEGANAVNETYDDWTVDCRLGDGRKICVARQSQGNRQTKQRVFAIELRMANGGGMEGTVLMPFGLKLQSGAILQLDGKEIGQGLAFSTCVSAGCLLPISLTASAIDAVRKGKTLTVAALSLANGSVVAFNISLKGFAAARARVGQLGD